MLWSRVVLCLGLCPPAHSAVDQLRTEPGYDVRRKNGGGSYEDIMDAASDNL